MHFEELMKHLHYLLNFCIWKDWNFNTNLIFRVLTITTKNLSVIHENLNPNPFRIFYQHYGLFLN